MVLTYSSLLLFCVTLPFLYVCWISNIWPLIIVHYCVSVTSNQMSAIAADTADQDEPY